MMFRRHAHPKMKRADVDRAVPHASTRIVGALHILIQVTGLPLPLAWLSADAHAQDWSTSHIEPYKACGNEVTILCNIGLLVVLHANPSQVHWRSMIAFPRLAAEAAMQHA